MVFTRYILPAATVLGGVAIIAIRGTDPVAMWGAMSLIGGGLSIYLLNWLFRLGKHGDKERDREANARLYLEKHGHWPDEAPPKKN